MTRRENIQAKINGEFLQFREGMLALPKSWIFEQCSRIRFYCLIREYFQDNGSIPEKILDLAESEAFSLGAAWWFYLKNEVHGCETWEEITVMLAAMYMGTEGRGKAWAM